MQELKIEMKTSADYNKTLRAIYESKEVYYDLLCAIYELAKKNNIDLTSEEVVELKVIRYNDEIDIEEYSQMGLIWINEDLQDIIKEKEEKRERNILVLIQMNGTVILVNYLTKWIFSDDSINKFLNEINRLGIDINKGIFRISIFVDNEWVQYTEHMVNDFLERCLDELAWKELEVK